MVFSSVTFLFYFLPLLLLVMAFARSVNTANIILLIFSVAFYAYGEADHIYIVFIVILVSYFSALGTEAANTDRSKIALAAGVAINLAIITFYKYTGFTSANLSEVLALPALRLSEMQLPLGISFFIFHAISYIVDVYRRVSPPQSRIHILALYILFFPQLIAGPIVRYHEIAAQLVKRQRTWNDFGAGAARFVVGLGKKTLIANPIGVTVDQIFKLQQSDLSFELAWLGAVLYALQLYFDFSGYSDMAIGLARMFGFRFPENFNYPYISQSIQEFWRRWHISLSNWFRDYLYIPLGGSRGSPTRTYANLLIVFFLCGLWHGAAWTFVVWGLWHGLFLILERAFLRRFLEKAWRAVRHAYAILVILIGWVLFRSEDLPRAVHFLSRMFNPSQIRGELYPLEMYFSNELITLTAAAIVFCMPAGKYLAARLSRGDDGSRLLPHADLAARTALCICCLVLSCMALSGQTHNPFLYFRF
jgi:alginate O-acetyltransferase complex protein AlgI